MNSRGSTKVKNQTYHLEPNEKLRMSFTTYELERSERQKESLTTYHLEPSERLTGLGETTNSSEGRG